jgi:GNAT superfamily N-acetyltransferase
MGHPIGQAVRAAAGGCPPPCDGGVDVVPPYLPGIEAVVAFTGHAVVATDLPAAPLAAAGADGFGGVTSPRVAVLLAGRDGEIDTLDVLLVARGTGRTGLPERHDDGGHPRVRHARHWRADVNVHGDERGLVTIARGVGGLPELSLEVRSDRRGRGLGRSLLRDALGLVPDGEPVLAAAAPGNAASLRSLLGAGFVPLGSVQLIRPAR